MGHGRYKNIPSIIYTVAIFEVSSPINTTMEHNESARVRINRKDQLDMLSKFFGKPRSKILDALVDAKYRELLQGKINNDFIAGI